MSTVENQEQRKVSEEQQDERWGRMLLNEEAIARLLMVEGKPLDSLFRVYIRFRTYSMLEILVGRLVYGRL